jgi:hypothetical protein
MYEREGCWHKARNGGAECNKPRLSGARPGQDGWYLPLGTACCAQVVPKECAEHGGKTVWA